MSETKLRLSEATKEAIREYERGNLDDVVARCTAILVIKPDDFEVLHLLAVTLSRLKRLEEALRFYDRAIMLQPHHAEALNNRGMTLHELKKANEALDSYDRALSLAPNYVEALYNKGTALLALKEPAKALDCYERVLAARPNNADALNNRGNALKELNRLDEALESYDRAISLRSDHAAALSNRGVVLHKLKRMDEALKSFDRALTLQPNYVDALNNRGNALHESKRFGEALDNFDNALKFRPSYSVALNNRGMALQELKRLDEALDSYDHALKQRPDYVEALYNRGIVLQELGRSEEALESYDQALRLRSDYVEALINSGNVLKGLNRLKEALESYDRALKLRPDDVNAHWNKSLLLLLIGRFTEGWKGYEWRQKKSDTWTERDFPGPEWQGDTSPGTRLLLYAEQGLGDTIQFARFARMLAKRGLVVSLEVQRPLKGLLDGLENVTIFRRGENSPPYKAHCPLMSVPFVLQMGLDDIRAEAPPYLAARQDLVERWRTRLPTNGLRVGITWQGDPKGKADLGRSIPARAFAPLARMEGVTLISLQKNDGVDQLRDLPADMRIVSFDDLDRGPDAFLDTAAIMMNLDLVITSDTSIAHLAGALGRPVWVALKHVPDWRWMLERSDSPWYPSMRLFRQSRPNDWDGVTSEMAAAFVTWQGTIEGGRSKETLNRFTT